MNPAELANKLLIELPPYYELVALLRAYGDARAEEMRERCAVVAYDYCTMGVYVDSDATFVEKYSKDTPDEAIRSLPIAPTPPAA